jgi:RNA polymerase sigma-70 factor (ECF subfamily)
MDATAGSYSGSLVRDEAPARREIEERIADSSLLAFRVAYSVLRNREDAEDVAQEAFARAFRRFPSLRNRDRFRSWLVRVVWRLALDRRRADERRLKREMASGPEPPAPTVEEAAALEERRAHLLRAVDALPEKLRQVVVLSAIEGKARRNQVVLRARSPKALSLRVPRSGYHPRRKSRALPCRSRSPCGVSSPSPRFPMLSPSATSPAAAP